MPHTRTRKRAQAPKRARRFHIPTSDAPGALDVYDGRELLGTVAVITHLRQLPAAHWLKRLPLETIHLLSPRPSMPPATYILAGAKPSNGAQDFIWLVFREEMTATAPAIGGLHRNREASS
jgi:hypothetical protein